MSFLKRLFNKPDDDDFAEFVQGELRKLGISDDAIEYDKANFALVVSHPVPWTQVCLMRRA